jgi:hypothetical protein
VYVAGAVVILVATFVLIGVARVPTVAAVVLLAPLSIALAYFTGAGPPTDES